MSTTTLVLSSLSRVILSSRHPLLPPSISLRRRDRFLAIPSPFGNRRGGVCKTGRDDKRRDRYSYNSPFDTMFRATDVNSFRYAYALLRERETTEKRKKSHFCPFSLKRNFTRARARAIQRWPSNLRRASPRNRARPRERSVSRGIIPCLSTRPLNFDRLTRDQSFLITPPPPTPEKQCVS